MCDPRYRERIPSTRLSVRLDRQVLCALDDLAPPGITRSEATREAIAEGDRERQRCGLAAEAQALVSDRAYVREAPEVAELVNAEEALLLVLDLDG